MTELKFDDQGLLVAIAQDAIDGSVRMVAWMNREALARTLQTGFATFFSRSRQALWMKGESSGNTLRVRRVRVDCDGDAVLLDVEAAGPSCHTGRPTCFFRRLDEHGELHDEVGDGATFVAELEREIVTRAASTASKSYTRHLLDGGAELIGAKLREEAGELSDAIGSEERQRVVSEAADVVYHLLVGLRSRDVAWREVIEALAARSGVSGHVEKAQREPPDA